MLKYHPTIYLDVSFKASILSEKDIPLITKIRAAGGGMLRKVKPIQAFIIAM